MKRKPIIVICIIALLFSAVPNLSAQDGDKGAGIIVDVLVARPAGLVATTVGSVFFVVALPFALMSDSVKPTANALVIKPAKATFTRPLGDFEALKE